MTHPIGIHHLAVSTGNMKRQIEFFTDVLGMELVALYWMHGVEGAWHGFLRLDDSCALAFVFIPGNEKIETQIGVTHAGQGAGTSAPGTMQHISFNVPTMDTLLNMRDRIRSRGVNVIGPMHHGFCQSIYFAGPENLTLEVATSDGAEHPLDNRQTWIDPEVVSLAGITDEELAQYTNPKAYVGESGAVQQPDYDAAKPHPALPDDIYQMLLGMPDEMVTAQLSETTPPNP
ncbi:MAG: VOC family protein [Pseudomonadota bacterium]